MSVVVCFGGSAFSVVIVMAVLVLVVLDGYRLDPRRGHHADTTEIRRLHQSVQPALEVQPVDDENMRLADRTGGGRRWPVDVRVAAWPDEGGDGHVLAADTRHHIAEDREGGDRTYRPVRRARGGGDKRQ